MGRDEKKSENKMKLVTTAHGKKKKAHYKFPHFFLKKKETCKGLPPTPQLRNHSLLLLFSVCASSYTHEQRSPNASRAKHMHVLTRM
jgi:hypothetical protein